MEDFTKAVIEAEDKVSIHDRREAIQRHWDKLVEIEVQCPFCSGKQMVQTVKRTNCRSCGRNYAVVYASGGQSNICRVPNGKYIILKNIVELEFLKTGGRRNK